MTFTTSLASGLMSLALLPVAHSSQHTLLTDTLLTSSLNTLDAVGSSQPSFPEPLTSSNPNYPLPVTDIAEPAILSTTVEDEAMRLERWEIASPAMGRVVDIQVIRPVNTAQPAPQVYLLGGADSPQVSYWISEGWAPEVFANEQATVIMPTQGYASYYSDWLADDPQVGRAQWETFLADELAPLMSQELNFNGKRAIGGISMGAIGAVHLANSRPDVYDAVIGISGCYSTTDPIGRLNTHVQVGMRGGDVNNMWGPFGSQTWHEHDVTANPTGLAHTAVYLYSGNGVMGERDLAYYANRTVHEAALAVVQERGTYHCTMALDQSMREHGMTHQRTVLDTDGTHNWNVFGSQLQPAWDHIKPALY